MSTDVDPTPAFVEGAWHDNALYGLRLDLGDPARDDWHSDLVLDIDHIVEWLRDGDRFRFRVAPATLTFHHVTDLNIAIDCGDTGGQRALHALSIDRVTREPILEQKICFDRPYDRWRILLNWPRGGAIGFAASGFSQLLRAESVVLDEQQLSPPERPGVS